MPNLQIMISILARNYSGLLDRRLRKVTCLASHKTGLTNVSWCHTNLTTLLQTLCRHLTPCHTHSHTCLSPPTRTTSPQTTGLIGNIYSVNTVVLPNCVPLAVSRRVRQSDPLPPTLFNLISQSLKAHKGDLPFGLFGQSASRSQEHYRDLVNSSFLRR